MNERQLRHFSVLAETLSFHAAAQKLNIVQPALSMSIRRLEDEIGVPLFRRTTREVSLTLAGQAALQEINRALKHMDRAKDYAIAAQQGCRGHLSIRFVGSASFQLLPPGVRAFRSMYPDVILNLEESTSGRILDQIRDGDIDIGIVRTPILHSPHATIQPVSQDKFVVVVPNEGQWALPDVDGSVALCRLAGYPFINFSLRESPVLHMAVVSACREAGFSPDIVQEAIQVQTLITLVESGLGVGMVPSVSAHHKPGNARFLQIEDASVSCDTCLALAYQPDHLTVVARNFVDTIMTLRQSQPGASMAGMR